MSGQLLERWLLAMTGAVGGALIWAIIEAGERDLIGDRASLVLAVLVGTALAATLAMSGPIGLAKALPRALGLGLVSAALAWIASLRFDEAYQFGGPLSALALLIVATLPVPFLIAGARSSWRDYPALFLEAWSIVVRFAAALAFTGLVWLVIFLSDQALEIVGITAISRILEYWIVPMLITGAVLGLGMAVVYELAELLSPYLVLRLFRLLLPAVLIVMLVFLAALPFRGFEGLFSGLSPAVLLLSMVGGGIGLIAISVDQSEAEATQSPLIRRAAQAMSLILPVLAMLAVWAIWLRVAQYGWTPERLFVTLLAVLGLVYAALYAVAVLRGADWMQRVRQANVWMALSVIGLAVLWLTPILNAEAISSRDQLARYEAGQTSVDALDIRALERWGRPGAEVVALLTSRSTEPGQEALARRLAEGEQPDMGVGRGAAELAALIALQPPTAIGTRDTLLAAAYDYQLQDWISRCPRVLPDGMPGCLMVVADLLPVRPGEEALMIVERGDDYGDVVGLYIDDTGVLATRGVLLSTGGYLTSEEVAALRRDWLVTPPPLTPARINQLGNGETGLFILP